jgi:hypothetical protein
MKVSLKELRDQIREIADLEGTDWPSDKILNNFINQSAASLYDMLVSAYGEDYYYKEFEFSTESGKESYKLPNDFYKLLGIDLILGPKERYSMKKFEFNNRNTYQYPSNQYFTTGSPHYYRLQGNNIRFQPEPTAVKKIAVLYIPKMKKLESDDDSFDGINGFDDFIIYDCAIKCAIKEETNTAALERYLEGIVKNIESMKLDRDAGNPMKVSYSQSWSDPDKTRDLV